MKSSCFYRNKTINLFKHFPFFKICKIPSLFATKAYAEKCELDICIKNSRSSKVLDVNAITGSTESKWLIFEKQGMKNDNLD